MVLLSGENTPLGQNLLPVLRGVHSVCSFGPDKGDIADQDFLEKLILQIAPSVFINTEQFDDPQKAELKCEDAYRINSYAPGIISQLCKKYNIFLIHKSSAHVYPPLKKTHHNESDVSEPSSVLADSLLFGEKKIIESGCRYCILRPAPIFGKNDNFLMTFHSMMTENRKIRVIKDQKIMPLYMRDAIDSIVYLVQNPVEGIFNAAGVDECTMYEFIYRFADLYQRHLKKDLSPQVEEITYDEFESTTDLPLYQLLNTDSINQHVPLKYHTIESALTELIHSTFM